MHIAGLRVWNVKGFGEGEEGVDLDLTAQGARDDLSGWTVLAGPNGSGKTTLLQAMAMALVDPLIHLDPTNRLLPWGRRGAESAGVALKLRRDPEDDPMDGPGGDEVDLRTEWLEDGRLVGSEHTAGTADEVPTRLDSVRGWFLGAYGPNRRVVGRVDDMNGGTESRPRRVAMMGLFRQDAYLAESVEWLKELDYRALKDDHAAYKLLQGVLALLQDDLLPGAVEILGVEPDGLRVKHRGTELLLQSLSDGYRTTAALVIDLVMRMSRVFRDRMRIVHGDGGPPHVPCSGVVLVDEMELHLHPAWQQKIGFWLKEHFPRVQFIVTTHSPFICQAADCLIRLSPPAEDRRVAEIVDQETFRKVVGGGADEAVVSDLFGLPYPHSARVERDRERLAALEARELRGALGDAERRELAALQERLPYAAGASVERVLRKVAAAR